MTTVVIVKNNTVADQWLSDFGVILSPSGQITLSETAPLSDIYSSQDLKSKVSNNIFLISNGSEYFDVDDALLYLDFTTDYELETTALSGVEPVVVDQNRWKVLADEVVRINPWSQHHIFFRPLTLDEGSMIELQEGSDYVLEQ